MLDPMLAAGIAALFGLMIGSFLNVLVYRLPKIFMAMHEADCASTDDNWVEPKLGYRYLGVPGSSCPACGHKIRWFENIPVVSWLALRARCSACGASISARYPLVEILGGLAGLLPFLVFGPQVKSLFVMALLLGLIALSFIDLDTSMLPDDLTLPLLWLGLLANLTGQFVPLQDAVIGAMAGYLTLWSVYWGFKLLTGREGMGYGDFKLLAALGAWMGWQALPGIVLGSSLVGSIFGVAMIVSSRLRREQPYPFGPYLAAAGAAAVFVGPGINTWYLGLLR